MSDQPTALRTTIGASSLGFGVFAIFAPLTLAKAFGMGDNPTPDTYYLARTWGGRNALLGAVTLMTARTPQAQRLAFGAAALNTLDAVVAFTTAGLSRRTRVTAGMTSAAYAATATYLGHARKR